MARYRKLFANRRDFEMTMLLLKYIALPVAIIVAAAALLTA